MSEPQASRPGSILRAEREALGVTVREVSETLNLSMAMIEAIEADDLERLPGPVFARGYVRAYARLLELDPEPLVSCYPKPQAPLPAAARPESPVWEEDRLAFTFTDDCWVEVRGADGRNLFSDLGRGGSRLVLVGEGPFHILLGYAPGVELAYNGEPLPLAPHTRNNVATLVLGQ